MSDYDDEPCDEQREERKPIESYEREYVSNDDGNDDDDNDDDDVQETTKQPKLGSTLSPGSKKLYIPATSSSPQ